MVSVYISEKEEREERKGGWGEEGEKEEEERDEQENMNYVCVGIYVHTLEILYSQLRKMCHISESKG